MTVWFVFLLNVLPHTHTYTVSGHDGLERTGTHDSLTKDPHLGYTTAVIVNKTVEFVALVEREIRKTDLCGRRTVAH